MAAETMSSAPHAATVQRQTVYVYGLRTWWTRLKLLCIYVVAVLLLLATSSSWDAYQENASMETLNPVFRSMLLFGMWMIAVVTAWRRGNTKVSRIDYLPDRAMIEVRTLNFLSRSVRLTEVRRVEYLVESVHAMTASHRKVIISIRDTLPIEVDLACAQIDQTLFEKLFPRQPSPFVHLSHNGGLSA